MLGDTLLFHKREMLIPSWSELLGGAVMEHDTSRAGFESRARSISVWFPEELVCVGPGTTCASKQLSNIVSGLQGNSWTIVN